MLTPCTGSFPQPFLTWDLVHSPHDAAEVCCLKTDTARPKSQPSRLSNLYESLRASMKGKMSPICHRAMKRGRPSSWVWQWREGKGERMCGRCIRFEVVLHAYRHLRWDGDAIRRVGRTFASDSTTDILTQTNILSAPQPPPRPPAATHSPVPSPNSVRLTFTVVSYKVPRPLILTPSFLHPSNLVRLILRFKPVFVVWHVAAYSVDVRRRAFPRFSIPGE